MSNTRYDAMNNVLLQPNAHSMGVMNLLKQYHPSFAKKVFEGNPLVAQLAMTGLITYDILKYPICGRCETLAAFTGTARREDGSFMLKSDGSKIGICRCLKCGCNTFDPITFEDWCLMELKKKAPNVNESDLRLAVDLIAEKCMTQAKVYLQKKIKEKAV
jgi:hypothetical protein